MHSVLIVSELGLYREGLVLALSGNQLFSGIEAVRSTEAALERASTMQPRVILLDLAVSNSLPAVRALRRQVPTAAVVVLSVPDIVGEIVACAEAGAAAYVTREASVLDLIATIERAIAGDVSCSAPVAAALFQRLSWRAEQETNPARFQSLSTRETEILRLIAQGLSNKQIAGSLRIETSTVKNHVHRILEKLNVRRRSEAAALMHGIPSAQEQQRHPSHHVSAHPDAVFLTVSRS